MVTKLCIGVRRVLCVGVGALGSWRALLYSLLFAFGALLQACDANPDHGFQSVASEQSGARPNIVVILTDDAGISDVGAYGGEIDTPNIDALANQGVMFRTFYANARCSPTRASLLTGMYPARAGFAAGTLAGWQEERRLLAYRGRLSEGLPILPEILRDAGYHTLMAGKWHLGGSLALDDRTLQQQWVKAHPDWPVGAKAFQSEFQSEFDALPRQRGFEAYFGAYVGETLQFLPTGTKNHRYFKDNAKAALNSTGLYAPYAPPGTLLALSAAENGMGDTFEKRPLFFAPAGVTQEAIAMLRDARRRDSSKPFFLYLAYQAPHAPLEAPRETVEKYLERYQDPLKIQRARVARWREKGWVSGKAAVGGDDHSDTNPSAPAERYATHAALVETVDQAIGEVVNALKAEGVFEDTLIVLLSDNGAASSVSDLANAPFRGAKGLLWEGGVRTHAVLHWPAAITTPRVTSSVGWVGDVMPTLLDVAGARYPAGVRADNGAAVTPLDGRSLLSIVDGRDIGAPPYLFFNDRGQQAVIHRGRWKLLVNPGWHSNTQRRGTTDVVLYDLLKDPTERRDVSSKKPRLVAKLLKKAKAWQSSQGIVDYASLLGVPD